MFWWKWHQFSCPFDAIGAIVVVMSLIFEARGATRAQRRVTLQVPESENNELRRIISYLEILCMAMRMAPVLESRTETKKEVMSQVYEFMKIVIKGWTTKTTDFASAIDIAYGVLWAAQYMFASSADTLDQLKDVRKENNKTYVTGQTRTFDAYRCAVRYSHSLPTLSTTTQASRMSKAL